MISCTRYLMVFFCLSMVMHLYAQEEIQPSATNERKTITLDEIDNNSKREEVQRYFGYETLFYRYSTLPYDISMNINQLGRFVDIGFLYLSIIPILIAGFLYRKKWLYYGFLITLIIYLSTCLYNSFIVGKETPQNWFNDSSWQEYKLSTDMTIGEKILIPAYEIGGTLAVPVNHLVEKISGDQDSFTYPFFFASLLLLSLTIFFARGISPLVKAILIVFITYGFLWLVLSGGIIWYGFLMIPLGLLLIGSTEKFQSIIPKNMVTYLRWVIVSTCVFWGFLTILLRMTNINFAVHTEEKHLGKNIVDGNLFYYTAGLLDEKQTIDNAFKNLSKAFDKINSTDQLVFQIGTSFAFDITKNPYRVFADNTLTNFLNILRKYPNKETFIDVLKASNFKFIVVDLLTPTIDKTPEKSLTLKYQILMNILNQNNRVHLISTDRIVEFTDVNGKNQRLADVNGKIVQYGSFAVYEIL